MMCEVATALTEALLTTAMFAPKRDSPASHEKYAMEHSLSFDRQLHSHAYGLKQQHVGFFEVQLMKGEDFA